MLHITIQNSHMRAHTHIYLLNHLTRGLIKKTDSYKFSLNREKGVLMKDDPTWSFTCKSFLFIFSAPLLLYLLIHFPWLHSSSKLRFLQKSRFLLGFSTSLTPMICGRYREVENLQGSISGYLHYMQTGHFTFSCIARNSSNCDRNLKLSSHHPFLRLYIKGIKLESK